MDVMFWYGFAAGFITPFVLYAVLLIAVFFYLMAICVMRN